MQWVPYQCHGRKDVKVAAAWSVGCFAREVEAPSNIGRRTRGASFPNCDLRSI